jgi:hypothetical protein
MNGQKLGSHRLAGAAGALAAGLGGAQSLDAAVAYHAVNVDIPADTMDYHVDINGDAVNEFDIQINEMRIKATEYGLGATTLRAADGAPANVPAGTVIGAASGVYSSTGLETLNGIEGGNPAGHFQVSDGPGFIGVQFPIGANIHFGYVGYQGTGAQNSANGRVYSLAYETTPLTAITAGAVPEPATLSLLAAGAAGVSLVRRLGKGEPA